MCQQPGQGLLEVKRVLAAVQKAAQTSEVTAAHETDFQPNNSAMSCLPCGSVPPGRDRHAAIVIVRVSGVQRLAIVEPEADAPAPSTKSAWSDAGPGLRPSAGKQCEGKQHQGCRHRPPCPHGGTRRAPPTRA